jgi:hypothetical protein
LAVKNPTKQTKQVEKKDALMNSNFETHTMQTAGMETTPNTTNMMGAKKNFNTPLGIFSRMLFVISTILITGLMPHLPSKR